MQNVFVGGEPANSEPEVEDHEVEVGEKEAHNEDEIDQEPNLQAQGQLLVDV